VTDASPVWFREHLLEELLPLWLRHAPSDSGLFRCRFDADWKASPDLSGTLTSQSRLIYNFSVGLRLTGEKRYEQALRAGAGFLLERFADPDEGGWHFSVDPRGRAVEEAKDSYGHAFMVFALAHAALATGDEGYAEQAREVWELIRTRFSDGRGGIWQRMSRDFVPRDEHKSQNPIMHLFEALLALAAVPGHQEALRDAEDVAGFVLRRLLRVDGSLPEFYDQDWRELPADRRGRIDIGHQFEWAFLLSRAAELGLDRNLLEPSRQLLATGMKLGFDAEAGGIFNAAAPDGSLLVGRKGWWQQCEAIRALMHHSIVRCREDLREPLRKSLEFFRTRFHDAVKGGWFPAPEGARHKGGPHKVDYHVVAMCEEALRLDRPSSGQADG